MAYFIFQKLENVTGTLYKIASNDFELNNLNIIQSNYKIIQDTNENFNLVRLNIKDAVSYSENVINYMDTPISFIMEKEDEELGYPHGLASYIDDCVSLISNFLKNNSNHPFYNLWNNYKNQLTSLDLKSITYPLNMSLEQYFESIGKQSLNTLQLP